MTRPRHPVLDPVIAQLVRALDALDQMETQGVTLPPTLALQLDELYDDLALRAEALSAYLKTPTTESPAP